MPSYFFLSLPECYKNIFMIPYAQWIRIMIPFDLSTELRVFTGYEQKCQPNVNCSKLVLVNNIQKSQNIVSLLKSDICFCHKNDKLAGDSTVSDHSYNNHKNTTEKSKGCVLSAVLSQYHNWKWVHICTGLEGKIVSLSLILARFFWRTKY